jgi:pectin methylesterase-like acyl-CoA thioesterase
VTRRATALHAAAAGSHALTQSVGGSGTGSVHEVRNGDSIQAAVAAAQPGDVIKIYPGTYAETVYIDKDDLILSGVVVNSEWPIMEGDKKLNDRSCTPATTSQSRTCRSSITRAMQ